MSLFGALYTAVSGLSAQSDAFGNISDAVSNSQTVGYKRVDTTFQDYLTQSSATINEPGSVVARPLYENNVQGTITQTSNPLNLAITGQGYFDVSVTDGSASASTNTQPSFSTLPYYTRAGDFSLDKNGYVVNSAGQYLNGWSVNPTTGIVNQNSVSPIHIDQTVFDPVATAGVTVAANLPATPTAGTATSVSPLSSQITVYDSLGTAQQVNLNWVEDTTTAGLWHLTLSTPSNSTTLSASASSVIGTADVQFNTNGTPASITPGPTGSTYGVADDVSLSAAQSVQTAGQPAALTFKTFFANDNSTAPQSIVLNLGTYAASNGITNFAGTTYNVRSLTQDGTAPGSFSSLSTNQNGDIIVNYDNGQSQTVARVPVITFNNPDGLQRQNGQAFTSDQLSGNPIANNAGQSGAGSLVTQSVESSNVDIATEFSNLIVTQQAYSANAKLITTADDMLNTTLQMKR